MFRRRKIKSFFCFIFISSFLTGCASQQLQLGAVAFEQGKYDVAAAHWNPLAISGDRKAQYALGVLWERGLGSTPKNNNEAANWYMKSAKQGFDPAMVRLANIQKAYGYNEAAHSWYVLAARWGNQDAVSALSAWGKAVPHADLLHQKQIKDAVAQQQASEAMTQAAYQLGCALAGGSCSSGYSQPSYPSYSTSLPEYTSTSRNASNTSVYSEKECSSDYSCGLGSKCVKAPLKIRGVCMRSVDEYGLRQHHTARSDSIRTNLDLDGQCRLNTDCPIGFQCDNTYRACVKK